jgi:DNA-binding transcriptional ArsR family regulator
MSRPVKVARLSPIGASIVEPSDDEELDQLGPEPDDEPAEPDDKDDEGFEESESEDVSSPTETAPPPPAKKPSPRAPGRKPAAQPPAKPAATSRSKAPPTAAPKLTAATRSKTPPASVRARQPSPNGSKIAVYRKSSSLLKLISDPTRLAIVDILRDGEKHVGDLCERLGNMTQPAVSHHLALLRHGRVIEPRREGKHNFYALTDECGQLLAGFVGEITTS